MDGITRIAEKELVVTEGLLRMNAEAKDTIMRVTQGMVESIKRSRVRLGAGHPSDSASIISVKVSCAEELANEIWH